MNERPILTPTAAVFLFPTLILILTSQRVPEIIKLILPIATFILGQLLERSKQKNEKQKMQKHILLKIQRKVDFIKGTNKLNEKLLMMILNPNESGYISILQYLRVVNPITQEYCDLDISHLHPDQESLPPTDKHLLSGDDVELIRNFCISVNAFNDSINDLLRDSKLLGNKLEKDKVSERASSLIKKINSLNEEGDKILKIDARLDLL